MALRTATRRSPSGGMRLTICWSTSFWKRTAPRPSRSCWISIPPILHHGEQEGRFYHGYYDHYCYLPLYVFAGEHVLCARLRPSNIDPSAGSRKEIERIVKQIRAAWPGVPIVLRGDSGFCREELMAGAKTIRSTMFSAWRAMFASRPWWPRRCNKRP